MRCVYTARRVENVTDNEQGAVEGIGTNDATRFRALSTHHFHTSDQIGPVPCLLQAVADEDLQRGGRYYPSILVMLLI